MTAAACVRLVVAALATLLASGTAAAAPQTATTPLVEQIDVWD